MVTRRQAVLALGAGAFTAPFCAQAQKQAKIWHIGFLAPRSRPLSIESHFYGAFLKGMRELGYVEGKDFVVEWRFADGNYGLLPQLAMDLVRLNVDVILTGSSPTIRAAIEATRTIPIVMGTPSDPVGAGFVASLSHPGGNVTGMTFFVEDIISKHVEMLKKFVPKLSSFALLENGSSSIQSKSKAIAETAARAIGVRIVYIDARTPQDIEQGIADASRKRIGGLIVSADAMLGQQRNQIASLALKHRLPTITGEREYAEAGCLLSYGQTLAGNFHRAAYYVHKIMSGSLPAELPVEQPTKFALIINRRTAKALSITIPRELLLWADEMIE